MEAKKIELFDKSEQENVFLDMSDNNAFSDLNTMTIFNFTNALIKKDLAKINMMLADINGVDIEGTGLITIFKNQLRNLINIQFNPYAKAADLGLTPKQYMAIKYNCNNFSNNQLIDRFDFITSLDYELKSGNIMFKSDNRENNAAMVDYITVNLLHLGGIK